MNELVKKFGDKLVILGVPCNQFGRQESFEGEEIYRSLEHVRPGQGFKPAFELTEKVDVNGCNAHPFFQYLRCALPARSDKSPEDEIENPWGILVNDGFKIPIWRPLSSSDITWNFEKFLIGPDGVPFRRYSPKFQTKDLESDIQRLIESQ